METSRTTWTAPSLAWWLSSESIRTCVHVSLILAAATVWGWHLFHSQLPIVWLLFESRGLFEGVYSKKYNMPQKNFQRRWCWSPLLLLWWVNSKSSVGILHSLRQFQRHQPEWATHKSSVGILHSLRQFQRHQPEWATHKSSVGILPLSETVSMTPAWVSHA